jgi:ankyrin repeat protein
MSSADHRSNPKKRKVPPPIKAIQQFDEAIRRVDVKAIRELLERHPALAVGSNVLHRLASSSQTEEIGRKAVQSIELLIEYGAELDFVNENGETALHAAASWPISTLEGAAVLLKHGANPNLLDQDGRSALHYAVGGELQTDAFVKLLLKFNADANACDPSGRTALHFAAANGRTNAVKILLSANANIDARDEHGLTPLFLATIMGHDETAAFLRKKGATGDATPEAVAEMGAIHYLVKAGKLDFVRSVLKNRPELLEVEDDEKQTPLHIAVRNERVDLVKFLLDAGANPNSGESRLATPLCNVIGKKEELRGLLLARGATPIHLLGLQMEGLQLDEISVSAGRRWVADTKDVAELEQYFGTTMPVGYSEFVCSFGEGEFDNWRPYMPWQIIDKHPGFSERMKEYAFRKDRSFWDNHAEVFSQTQVENLICITDSIDGDEVVFVRGEPDRLYVLPRHDSYIRVIGGNYYEALRWMNTFWSSDDSRGKPSFEIAKPVGVRAEVTVPATELPDFRRTLEKTMGNKARTLRNDQPPERQSFRFSGFPYVYVRPTVAPEIYAVDIQCFEQGDFKVGLKLLEDMKRYRLEILLRIDPSK